MYGRVIQAEDILQHGVGRCENLRLPVGRKELFGNCRLYVKLHLTFVLVIIQREIIPVHKVDQLLKKDIVCGKLLQEYLRTRIFGIAGAVFLQMLEGLDR